MKSNLYKLTVEYLEDTSGKNIDVPPLVFETRSHEDFFKIVEVMKAKVDLDETDATAFAVGLKIFSGVMVNNKDHGLFKQLMPHLVNIMKTIKKL